MIIVIITRILRLLFVLFFGSLVVFYVFNLENQVEKKMDVFPSDAARNAVDPARRRRINGGKKKKERKGKTGTPLHARQTG